MPENSLDPSWMMVLLHASAKGWQFGKDIVFTYGPLGFFAAPQFYPGLYEIALGFWLVFYGATAAGFCLLYRTAGSLRLGLLVCIMLMVSLTWAHDGPWFAACVVLFLLARKDDRPSRFVGLLLAAVIAGTTLIKTTSLLLALPTMILADIAALRAKRAPVHTAVFGLAFVAAYLAAGQSVSSLGPFLATAFNISSGYSDAMQVYGWMAELAVFALATGLTAAAIALHELSRKALLDAALAAAMFALFVLVIAKTGFVRHDVGHAMIPWTALTLASLAYLGDVRVEGRPARIRIALLSGAIFIGAVLFCVTYVGGAREAERTAPAAKILAGDLGAQLKHDTVAVVHTLFGNQRAEYRAAYEAQLANIRKRFPLPSAAGVVDIFGVNQAIVLAGGYDYRPRPVFQGYSVYTPELIALNREAITGPHAPGTIFFEIDTVDNRYPSLDEGALWPDLLRHYDAVQFQNDYAVLKRRATPRTVTSEDLREDTIAFDQEIDVSGMSDGLLWLELDIRPTLLGRLRSLLFKPPMMAMTVTTNAGNVQTFRIVPGMARAGFLLSPLVESADQFALLPAHEETISRFSLAGIGRPAGMFQSAVSMRLKRLHVEGPNEMPTEMDMEVLARKRTLRALAASAGAVPGQKKAQLLPEGKALAHAPSRLFLTTPAGVSGLTFTYGILDGAWAEGNETDGACFRVSSGAETLHEACLDPKRIADDRTPRTLTVATPPEGAPIVFETLIRENGDWDWTYWSDLAFK